MKAESPPNNFSKLDSFYKLWLPYCQICIKFRAYLSKAVP